jgi:hypothetical protein
MQLNATAYESRAVGTAKATLRSSPDSHLRGNDVQAGAADSERIEPPDAAHPPATMHPTDVITPPDNAPGKTSAWGEYPGMESEGTLWWRLALAVALAVVALAATASLLA